MSEISILNGYKIKDKKAVRYYDNISNMKSDTTLKAGMYVKTKGYYSINDNGGAEYFITDTQSNTEYQEELSNNLYATLIIDNSLNVDQLGAKGDSTTDDTTIIQNAIDFCLNNNYHLNFSKKTYLISQSLILNKNTDLKIIINGNNGMLKGNFSDYIIKANVSGSQKFIIENLELNGNYVSNGILIDNSNRFSLKNIIFHYCLKGLTIINSWYGNVDNNCLFDTCLHSINIEEDVNDQYYGEVNTIEFENLSIDAHNILPSNFNSEDTYSTGIKVDGLVHAVKFIGVVVENVDIGVYGGNTLRNSVAALSGNITFDKCYFEDNSEAVIDWIGTNSHYINTNVIFINNHLHPFATLKAKLNYSRFYIENNSYFFIEPYTDNRNLVLFTDLNDYYINTKNYNYTTKVFKIDNSINRTKTMQYDDPSVSQEYPSNRNMTLCIQEDNYLLYQFFMNNSNVTVKNSKAYSINSKNISFDKETLNPVGVIINGTNDKKYMLSTDDGTSVKLIEMNNINRIYERANSYDAYWLYANRNNLDNGFKAYCNDIGKNVKLVKNGDSAEWWTDESNSYLCIGTSESLYSNLSNQPSLYWRPCWDLSFNRGVFLHGDRYNLAYDWAMNNNPQNNNTQILVYGAITSRPANPTYNSIYYATDEDKYYRYNLSNTTWSEVNPIM